MIYEPLSYWKFKDTKWRLPKTLAHCSERPTLALTRRDLRTACRVSPIAFATTPRGLTPVLLNSREFNRVPMFEERWSSMRLPSLVALYPFSIVWHDRDQQWVLGVARDPETIGVDEGELFFTPEGPLTRRLSVAYRRLCIAQAYRPALVEAAKWLHEQGFLEDLPATTNSRIGYKVMRRDRLDEMCQVKDDLALELAYAAAFSLRALPDVMAASLSGCQTPAGPSKGTFEPFLELNAKRSIGEQTDTAAFLVDDDDTLTFSFSARASVFKSG